MYSNNILIDQQFGFRNNHSIILQLIRVVHHIANEHNKNRLTGMILLDLNKAFDSVWHNGLLLKLDKYNFPDHILKFISSFLANRSFTVKVNKGLSTTRAINAGVPQGSVLGSILFNIFINDPPRNPKTLLSISAILASSWSPIQLQKYFQAHINSI